MLDRTQELARQETEAADGHSAPPLKPRRGLTGIVLGFWQFFHAQGFSSLTRRIILLNIAGLLVLVIGILSLSQFRAGLIDARVRSLQVQADIIAGAIAASATVETDSITIDPDKLLQGSGKISRYVEISDEQITSAALKKLIEEALILYKKKTG